MRRLLKFSYSPKDSEVAVRYEVDTPDGRIETHSLEAAEEPAPALVAALALIAPHVCALCEFPPEWAAQLTVRGVTIKRGESKGLTITALRKLKGLMTPLVVNTPFTTEFGLECDMALEELERLALGYVDGERAQGTLDLRAEVEHASNQL